MTKSTTNFVFAATFLLVASLLFSSSSSSPFVLANSPPCNCYNGRIEKASPRCVCDCSTSGGFIPPFCSFKPNDMVRIEVWFDTPPLKFISDSAVETMQNNLRPLLTNTTPPVDVNRIEFLYIVTSPDEQATMGLFDMPGGCVNWLYHNTWNVDNRTAAWPYAQANINAVYLTQELSAPEPFLSSVLRNTYLYNDGKVAVSLADSIWLIGVLIFVIAVPVIESVYTHNDEKSIEMDVATGQFDPFSAPPKQL